MAKFAISAIIFALLASALALSQTKAIDEHITVLSSADIPHALLKQRIGSCLVELLHQWKLSDKKLPHIVVFHASKKAAVAAYVTENVSVRKNRVVGGNTDYFEIWIVGEPSVRNTIVALENILEIHYELTVKDEDRKTVMARVLRIEDATVGVEEGK